jgi:predicted enzyme related to lactoylglutathione lyase
MDLAWIVVSDFNAAIKFYTEVVGLKLVQTSEEWGWAELQGETGARLGISTQCEKSGTKPGQNAIPCFTVKNLDDARSQMEKATPVGEICEVPGHVRMQLYRDADGNQFHVVQNLEATV